MSGAGVEIVLTSDLPTISSFGNDPFKAFLCTFPHRLVRRFLEKYLEPQLDEEGRPLFASYGLRKVESVLVHAFGEERVAVAHPSTLERFVGRETRVIGVSSHDPLGLAYVSRTYNTLLGLGGEAVNRYYFRQLLEHPVIRGRGRNTKLVVGGPGAWQIGELGLQDSFGIDVLVHGDAERGLVELMRRLLEGEEVGREVWMERVDPERDFIPPILRPASYGCVEITRGCGRGCRFCSPTTRKPYSFPLDYVMREVEVNVRGGSRSLFVVTDDLFLYGVKPRFHPNREKLVKLLSSMAGYPGVEEIHLSHAAMAPVVADPGMIGELTPILLEKTKRRLNGEPYVTAEVGVETGSVRLMEKNMHGKALPFSVRDWHEIVDTGLGILNDHSWYPLCTFLVGTPEEEEEDVIQTLELLDRIEDKKLFYVPVLFIPIKGTAWENERCVGLRNLSELQWEVIARAWSRNVRIWKRNRERVIRALGFLFFWSFLLWKHGPRCFRPVMRFLGVLPQGRLPGRE